jgi:glycerate 2-kinase
MVKLHRHALAIFKAALKAADPVEAVTRFFARKGDRLTVAGRVYDLRRFNRVIVLGAGKASAAMAIPVERALGSQPSSRVRSSDA